MDKRFWGFLVAVALVLGGIFFITNTNKAGAPSAGSNTKPTNHVYSQGSSGIKLVEYGDFQCPACAAFYPTVKQVKEKYKDTVSFQFRHFPLFQIHPNAIASSRAAEAAGMQGKFWEMHDTLYENQDSWAPASDPTDLFRSYASTIGLNIDKFNEDYKSNATNDKVQADLREGNKQRVTSTPTFILDGKKISNPENSVEGFSKVIDAALAKKGVSASPSPAASPEQAQDQPAAADPNAQ